MFFVLTIVFWSLDSELGKTFFQIMSIVGFICGSLGSIMDLVMMVLYVIIVKRFFELLFVEN